MSDLASHFNFCKQGAVFKQGADVVLLILLNRSLKGTLHFFGNRLILQPP